MKLFEEIRESIAKMAEVEPEEINPKDSLIDIGIDSFMALELVATLERKYKIQIPETLMPKFKTLEDTVNITRELIKACA